MSAMISEAEQLKPGEDKILAQKQDGIGWLVFNNPERRNAISLEMWQSIIKVLDDFDEDPAVRVIVMRGAGGKAFAAGADISEFDKKRGDAAAAAEYRKIPDAGRARIESLRKPLIAMIQGFCIGGGLGIAMKADLRIASEDSQFGIPAARLGLAYAFESLRTLTQLVGPAYAKEILFTARRLDSSEALRIGLVNRVVPADQLEPVTREVAASIAENAPLTVQASKFTVGTVLKDPQDRDMQAIQEMMRICMDSEDYAEGRRAFQEKRKPRFRGR